MKHRIGHGLASYVPVATRANTREWVQQRRVSTWFGGVPIAQLEMPKIRVKVDPELAKKVVKASEQLWPGQGARALNRLTRDAIRRYGRYADGRTRGND